MKANFLLFRTFFEETSARELAGRLDAAGISYQIEDNKQLFDPSFAVNPVQRIIEFKLRQEDFLHAETILNAMDTLLASQLPASYHLFSATDKELLEIIRQPDLWSHIDFTLAHDLLEQRGKLPSSAMLEYFREQRRIELAQPEAPGKYILYMGYLLALLFWSAIAGLMVGLLLVQSKKILPDGSTVYRYKAVYRRHGKAILLLCLFSLVGWSMYHFYRTYQGKTGIIFFPGNWL